VNVPTVLPPQCLQRNSVKHNGDLLCYLLSDNSGNIPLLAIYRHNWRPLFIYSFKIQTKRTNLATDMSTTDCIKNALQTQYKFITKNR